MSDLERAQAEFQQHLQHGDTTVVPRIAGDERAGAQERLEVYYQAYRLRLVDVLRNDFAGLAVLLGEDFETLGEAYLQAWPSVNPSVRWFGRRLSDFLANTTPWRERPELAEMAAFEWAWGQAFDAADDPVAGPEELQVLPPAQWGCLAVELHSSVRQLKLHWNVPAVFGAVAREETLPAAARGEHSLAWLVWRRDLVVKWRSMDDDEAWALQAAAAGQDFAGLCAGLCDWHAPEQVPLQAAGMLKTWLTDGLISRIRASGNDTAC